MLARAHREDAEWSLLRRIQSPCEKRRDRRLDRLCMRHAGSISRKMRGIARSRRTEFLVAAGGRIELHLRAISSRFEGTWIFPLLPRPSLPILDENVGCPRSFLKYSHSTPRGRRRWNIKWSSTLDNWIWCVTNAHGGKYLSRCYSLLFKSQFTWFQVFCTNLEFVISIWNEFITLINVKWHVRFKKQYILIFKKFCS